MLVGGEAVSGGLCGQLGGAGGAVTNLYGPTETTVWSALRRLTAADAAAPPIGCPILNTRVYVLDGGLEPVPAGVAGGLFIAGGGVARGYLGRAGLAGARL